MLQKLRDENQWLTEGRSEQMAFLKTENDELGRQISFFRGEIKRMEEESSANGGCHTAPLHRLLTRLGDQIMIQVSDNNCVR